MILLVDDESREMRSYIDELRRAGINVRHEAGVDNALKAVEEIGEKLDLAILDIMMPQGAAFAGHIDKGRRTGVHLYQQVRAMLPDLPMIIFTNVPRDRVKEDLELDDRHWFLQKEHYFPHEFAEEVQQMLRLPS